MDTYTYYKKLDKYALVNTKKANRQTKLLYRFLDF